jgi:aromatic ring-cleaving dioxygenase
MGAIFDNCTRMCVWDPVMGVDGPHPYGQWGVYLPNEMLADTVAWMSENHGEFEVLFHPNTGLMVGDHDPARRAMWIKETVPLDLDFLRWLQCKWFGCSDGLSQ